MAYISALASLAHPLDPYVAREDPEDTWGYALWVMASVARIPLDTRFRDLVFYGSAEPSATLMLSLEWEGLEGLDEIA